MIEVTEQNRIWQAFYYKDIEQEDIQTLIQSGLAYIMDCDIFGGEKELFVKTGTYKSNFEDDEIDKIVNVQRGCFIVVCGNKMANDSFAFYGDCKVLNAKSMKNKYKALLDKFILTEHGIEQQAQLFDSVEIKQDDKTITFHKA